MGGPENGRLDPTLIMNYWYSKSQRIRTGKYFLQVAGCRLKFHYNWKTADTKKKGKAIDLP